MFRYLLLSFLIFITFPLYSQKNSTLFFLPNAPQANFVNPAVTNKCRLIIGLPILSSVHLNAGSSGFSMNQVLKKQSDNTYEFNGNSVINRLGPRNYFDTELHTNLLFVGYWYKKNYLTFTINEKADAFLTYPRDLFALAWQGNTQFEGETAKLGPAVFLNYRREFALGIARQTKSNLWWGARGKLLFGKLNTTVTKSKIDLFTDPVTFDLNFDSDWQMNTSLPITVNYDRGDTVNSVRSNNPTAGGILFNRKNLGFSVDLGFIQQVTEWVTVSGSILDLGFISWKDNGYSFNQNGQYTYTGPLGDSIDDENYLDDLGEVIRDEFGVTAKSGSYLTLLSPRVYLGATYEIGEGLTTGILGTAKINRFKIASAITLSLNKQFNEAFSGSLSYSYAYRDFKNLGLAFKAGRKPLQFYAATDNVLGFVIPRASRNVNLRFGLQFNFGCDATTKFGGCGCYGMEQELKHRKTLNKLTKKKN